MDFLTYGWMRNKNKASQFETVDELVVRLGGVKQSLEGEPKSAGALVEGEDGWIALVPSKSFVTVHARPILAADVRVAVPPRDAFEGEGNLDERVEQLRSPRWAILVQGQLATELDFTLETVKLYRRLFPQALVLVSTWNNSDEALVAALRATGATVLLNEPPTDAGWGNINYQIVSTKNGMKAAAEAGCTYAFKTRSDWRMYKPNALDSAFAMLQAFPAANAAGQKSRIGVCSVATLKYRVYGTTDMLQFGAIEDLIAFWDVDEYDAGVIDLREEYGYPPIRDGVPLVSESYLCMKFLQRCGVELDFTLSHWWEMLRDRFCVFDAAFVDAYWHKYESFIEYRFARSYLERGQLAVDFSDWLELVTNKEVNWGDLPYRESWTHEARPGLPGAGGIYQEAH